MSSLREEFEQLRIQKHHKFNDLDRMIRRIVAARPGLFPKFDAKSKRGVKVVYHFHAGGLFPISLEKEHRGRDHVPPKYAKRALASIEELLVFVEEQP